MRHYCFSTLMCAVFACLGMPARAGIITMDLNHTFSGIGPASGVLPWLNAQFDDHGSLGSVTITLSASHLTGTEYVSGWYVNLDPAMDPTALVFSAPVKTGAFDDPSVGTGVNAYKADGDGHFDILFGFATYDGAPTRFGAGDSCQITVSGIPTLSASSFSYKSNPPATGYYSAAHVQAIGADSLSGWISATSANEVPEPAAFVPVIFGIAGMLPLLRRSAKPNAPK